MNGVPVSLTRATIFSSFFQTVLNFDHRSNAARTVQSKSRPQCEESGDAASPARSCMTVDRI